MQENVNPSQQMTKVVAQLVETEFKPQQNMLRKKPKAQALEKNKKRIMPIISIHKEEVGVKETKKSKEAVKSPKLPKPRK